MFKESSTQCSKDVKFPKSILYVQHSPSQDSSEVFICFVDVGELF